MKEQVASPAPAADEEEQKKRQCPVCGATWTKTWPTLANVRLAIREVLLMFKEPLGKVEPACQLGYRGSVAAGKVGNPNKPHYGKEPDIRGECGTKYDVDGFLLTREVWKEIKPDRAGKRWAKRHGVLRGIEAQIQAALAARAELVHMKKGSDGFELLIRTMAERAKLQAKGPMLIILTA